MSFNWECPYCGRKAVITDQSYHSGVYRMMVDAKSKDGDLCLISNYIVCPNRDCLEYTIQISVNKWGYSAEYNKYVAGEVMLSRMLKPQGAAKPFPDYIPSQLREDYTEACLILDDSPKASATLSRRCLQGVIRHFFEVTKKNLSLEIKALKDIVDSDLWNAIDGVREIGNVGAHFEKDVNLIVDVSHDAAVALIQLIELLFEETYIRKNDRQERIQRTISAAQQIKEQKDNNAASEN